MAKTKMMPSDELDKIAKAQYRKALTRYVKQYLKEESLEGESDFQLYVRTITWYNAFFEGVHANDSGSLPPPPPPPPPNH